MDHRKRRYVLVVLPNNVKVLSMIGADIKIAFTLR